MRKTESERFWEKVNKVPGGCWEWTASTAKGYGHFGVGGRNGSTIYAHRWAYEHLVGPIPKGLQIDHAVCQNKICVNPDHLEPVTPKENTRRYLESKGWKKNNAQSRRTHCPHGHPYSGENLKIDVTTGQRICRECRKKVDRAYNAKRASRKRYQGHKKSVVT
jgi:hypothetical protein